MKSFYFMYRHIQRSFQFMKATLELLYLLIDYIKPPLQANTAESRPALDLYGLIFPDVLYQYLMRFSAVRAWYYDLLGLSRHIIMIGPHLI